MYVTIQKEVIGLSISLSPVANRHDHSSLLCPVDVWQTCRSVGVGGFTPALEIDDQAT